MIDFSQIEILQGIPQNTVGSIFLAGMVAGFILTVVFLLLFNAGSEKRRSAVKQETPHDVIMAIKQRAAGGRAPISIFGFFGFILATIAIFIVVFAIVAVGRFLSEGVPNEEAFVPFVLRIFVFPLLDKYPALQNLIQ